MRILRRTDR